MPSPVEALPCGSRSTIRTCSPIAASAVPRLIAVVVLPTPPFWLAMARMRSDGEPLGETVSRSGAGAGTAVSVICVHGRESAPRSCAFLDPFYTADRHDAAAGIRSAGDKLNLQFPICRRFGQLTYYILTLWKQAERSLPDQLIALFQEAVQWR